MTARARRTSISPSRGIWFYNSNNNDGIKVGIKETGADRLDTGGSIVDNVVCSTNQDGISVYTSITIVDGNKVCHSTSENGAIYVSFAVNNVTLTNNYIHDNGISSDLRTT